MAGGLSATSQARTSKHKRVRPQATAASVNSLLRRMTVAEKFGQLEMSGPTGDNGAPGATLLVTSRAPLRVPGERELDIDAVTAPARSDWQQRLGSEAATRPDAAANTKGEAVNADH